MTLRRAPTFIFSHVSKRSSWLPKFSCTALRKYFAAQIMGFIGGVSLPVQGPPWRYGGGCFGNAGRELRPH